MSDLTPRPSVHPAPKPQPKPQPKLLTAAEAIQKVLADPDYVHVGAHGTEFFAVEKLVKQGMNREQAEREVRMLLY